MTDFETQIGLKLLAERENDEIMRRYEYTLALGAYIWLMTGAKGSVETAMVRRVMEAYAPIPEWTTLALRDIRKLRDADGEAGR
jgi:hypothetical protein